MGKRFNKRKLYRRRQQAGFTVFVSLVTVVLGGMLFFGANPSQRMVKVSKIERVNSPEIAEAPEAVADLEAQKAKAEKRSAAAEPVEVPDIPYNATEREAEELLKSSGLKLGDVEKKPSDEYEKGGVFLQDPLPAVKAKKGSSVDITLSSGPKKEVKKDSDGKIPTPSTNDLYLSVPRLGLYDNYVANTENPAAMDNGAIKLPSAAFPWQDNGNSYIAAHRIGYSGTPS